MGSRERGIYFERFNNTSIIHKQPFIVYPVRVLFLRGLEPKSASFSPEQQTA